MLLLFSHVPDSSSHVPYRCCNLYLDAPSQNCYSSRPSNLMPFFKNARNVDARYSTFSDVAGDQINTTNTHHTNNIDSGNIHNSMITRSYNNTSVKDSFNGRANNNSYLEWMALQLHLRTDTFYAIQGQHIPTI